MKLTYIIEVEEKTFNARLGKENSYGKTTYETDEENVTKEYIALIDRYACRCDTKVFCILNNTDKEVSLDELEKIINDALCSSDTMAQVLIYPPAETPYIIDTIKIDVSLSKKHSTEYAQIVSEETIKDKDGIIIEESVFKRRSCLSDIKKCIGDHELGGYFYECIDGNAYISLNRNIQKIKIDCLEFEYEKITLGKLIDTTFEIEYSFADGRKFHKKVYVNLI